MKHVSGTVKRENGSNAGRARDNQFVNPLYHYDLRTYDINYSIQVAVQPLTFALVSTLH